MNDVPASDDQSVIARLDRLEHRMTELERAEAEKPRLRISAPEEKAHGRAAKS